MSLAVLMSCQASDNMTVSEPIKLETKQEQPQQPSKQHIKEVKQTTTAPKEPTVVHIPTGIVPERIVIPSIQVDASVSSVGLLEDGAVDVPEETDITGWFEPGAKPGAYGNAVIVGHVDSYKGPAVFFHLKKLKPGDEILLYGEHDSTPLRFVVTEKKAYPYDQAPISHIFGYTPKQQLNLITCTGFYDRKTNTHLERLVVTAELK
ncbi:class F sortase [Bacillus sp. HMF5848]|uniref:class F sortase n=1 Tax=Bacillus sp. HMF5848 TaxID=2495421 RepID=UPI000F7ABDF3|nr:class F sortase [Bacillus sp. HMF5848]RSK25939.1 class F sortase [Bacillus sp. HMF5848]